MFLASLYASNIDKSTIKIGVFKNLAPYSFYNPNNQLDGIVVDYWKLWAKKSRKRINFVPISFQTLNQDIKHKDIDVFAGLFPIKSRKKHLYFVNPYYKTKSYIYINKEEKNNIKTIKDIENKNISVGVLKNSFYEEYLQHKYPNLKLKTYDSIRDIQFAFHNKKINLFVSDSLVEWLQSIKGNFYNKTSVIQDFEIKTPFYAAVLKKDKNLAGLIKEESKKISYEEIENIQNRWVFNDSLKYISKNKKISLSKQERLWLLKNPVVKLAAQKGRDNYIFVDTNGILQGYNVDLINQINKNLGTQITLKLFDGWDSAYEAAKNSKVDGILSLSYLKSREKYFNFSPVYKYGKTNVITRENEENIKNLEDINNKIFVVQKNSIGNNIVKEEAPNAKIIYRKDLISMIKALENKEADVMLQEDLSDYNLKEYGLKINNKIYTKLGEYTIGTDKNKPILASIIEKGVYSLTKEQKKALEDKWFRKKSIFTNKEKEYIKNSPTLIIGVDNWRPISYVEDKKIKGIVGEFFNEIEKISGLKFKYKADEWQNLYQEFKDKKIDIISASYILKDREKIGIYSKKYFSVKDFLYVKKDNNSIKSFKDLSHKKLAIVNGYVNENCIKKEFPNIKIVTTKNLEESIKKLLNGDVEALYEPQLVMQEKLKKLVINDIKAVYQDEIDAKSVHVFSQKDNKLLASIINKSLQSISQEKKNSILEKWLYKDNKSLLNVAFGEDRGLYAIDDKYIKGVEYDLVNLILENMDISFNFSKTLTLNKMQNALKNDSKLDVAVTLKKQKDKFYYSDDFVSFENVAITRVKDKHYISKPADLKNKKVLAFSNAYLSLGDEYYNIFRPEKRLKNYKEIISQQRQVEEFLDKNADVVILDKNIFAWYLKKLSTMSLDEYRFDYIFSGKNSYQVGFRDKNLRDRFNKNLQKIKDSGKYNEVFYNYLESDIQAKSKVTTILSAVIAKAMFYDNKKEVQKIVDVFQTMSFINKVEVFDANKNLFYETNDKKFSNDIFKNIFYITSNNPQKVGKVHIYFNENILNKYIKNNFLIPKLNNFAGLDTFSYIKSIYKRFDVMEEELKFTQKEKNYIKNNKTIKISAIQRNPLFIYNRHDDVYSGIYVDIMNLVAEKTGLKFDYDISKNWNESSKKLLDNKVKLMMSNSAVSDYKKEALVSKGFIEFQFAIVSNKDAIFVSDINSLEGKTLALPNPSPSYELIKNKYANLNLKIIETKTPKEALELVKDKKADVFIGHEAYLINDLKSEFSDLKIIGLSEEKMKHNFIINPNDKELLLIINKALKSISYKKKQDIKDKWMHTKINTAMDYTVLYKVVGIFIIALLVIIVSNRRLKYLVEEKTYELNHLLNQYAKNVVAIKTDKRGRIIYASDAFCDKFGYTYQELKLESIIKIGYSKVNIENILELKKAFRYKQSWTGKMLYESKSLNNIWIKIKMLPEYNKKQEFIDFTFIFEDITAQKEVENLNQEIQNTQKEIIFKMGAIGEARSQETGLHVKRVAQYSKLFAHYYGLDKKEIDIIELASPMHDIGKVAIADSILNKPSKLTSEEFELIKSHARLGYDMLKGSNRTILKTAAIIAHEHHEKYDGTGYPQGLKGEDIHIYGRITAIADVFDALGSKRVYKEAWDDARIFEFFIEQRAKHFDPKLVDIFFDNLSEFLAIRDKFKDSFD